MFLTESFLICVFSFVLYIYMFDMVIIASFSLRLPKYFCRWPPADRRWQLSYRL